MSTLGWGNVFGSGQYTGPTGGIQYLYSATQNNGQITGVVDSISGETVSYQYDALKRLTSSGTTAWSQSYQYDGFGNLTAKVLNGTTTPLAVDANTNRLSGLGYDLNGNMTTGTGVTLAYDEANRAASATLVSGGTEYYGYAPDNKRIYKLKADGTESWTFYGARGEKLVTDLQVAQPNQIYTPQGNPTGQWAFSFVNGKGSVWFGGRLISEGGSGTTGAVYQDRLGTNRAGGAKFYPYGEEAGTATANDRTKFGTYTRDSFTGLDYADQRFYASSYGRFNTADPYRASGGASDPGSWNRYAYVGGDPINWFDPIGLFMCNPESPSCRPPNPPGGGGTEPGPSLPCNGFTSCGPGGEGGGGGGTTDTQDEWSKLSQDCQQGLQTAVPKTGADGLLAALHRAEAARSVLQTAVGGTTIGWGMLAAIGIRESGFRNVSEADGAGVGVGIFQLTVSASSGVTASQAGDLSWAATYAANMLNGNRATLAAKFPGLTPEQLMQATAASYNFGVSNISGNPATIDIGSARNNYGSNIVQLAKCF